MTKAVIYTRISDDREGRSLGVERQEQQCRELAARLGYNIVKVYEDNDRSASRHSRKARPNYKRMLADARDLNFEVILAATTNRLTRRPREYEDLIDLFDEAGTTYEFVKSPKYDLKTAAGRKFARYAAADDAAESDEISERVKDRLDQRKAAGLPHGGHRPYGWEKDRQTIREAEMDWVRWGAKQTLAGVPIRTQFRELNARGVLSSIGRPWNHATWRGVLMNARHAGLMPDGSPGAAWPAGITPEQHRAIVRLLSDPARVTTPGRAGRLHLLSGIARCAVEVDGKPCDRPLRVGKSKGKRTEDYEVYRCYPGAHVTRHREHVDAYVLDVTAEFLRHEKVSSLLARDADEGERAKREAAEAEAGRLRLLIDEAAAEHGSLGLPLSALAAYTAPLREQLAEAEKASERPRDRSSVLDGAEDADDPGTWFLAQSKDRQRAIIGLLFDIRIGRGPRGNVFRPEGITITRKEGS